MRTRIRARECVYGGNYKRMIQYFTYRIGFRPGVGAPCVLKHLNAIQGVVMEPCDILYIVEVSFFVAVIQCLPMHLVYI